MWDLNRKNVKAELSGHKDSVFCVDISEDNLNAISGDYNSRILYWDLVKLKLDFEFESHTGGVYSIKFTKNKQLATSVGEDKKSHCVGSCGEVSVCHLDWP